MGALVSSKRSSGRLDVPVIRADGNTGEDLLEVFDCEEDGDECEHTSRAIRPFLPDSAARYGSQVRTPLMSVQGIWSLKRTISRQLKESCWDLGALRRLKSAIEMLVKCERQPCARCLAVLVPACSFVFLLNFIVPPSSLQDWCTPLRCSGTFPTHPSSSTEPCATSSAADGRAFSRVQEACAHGHGIASGSHRPATGTCFAGRHFSNKVTHARLLEQGAITKRPNVVTKASPGRGLAKRTLQFVAKSHEIPRPGKSQPQL